MKVEYLSMADMLYFDFLQYSYLCDSSEHTARCG